MLLVQRFTLTNELLSRKDLVRDANKHVFSLFVGFVSYDLVDSAENAITAMNGFQVVSICVCVANYVHRLVQRD